MTIHCAGKSDTNKVNRKTIFLPMNATSVKSHVNFLFSEKNSILFLDSPRSTIAVITQLLVSHVQLFVVPWACSPPGSSTHRIFQVRILKWGAIPFSRESFQPKDQTQSPTAGRFSMVSDTMGAHYQRDNCKEPTLLHFPIRKKSTKFMNFAGFITKLLCILAPSLPLQ